MYSLVWLMYFAELLDKISGFICFIFMSSFIGATFLFFLWINYRDVAQNELDEKEFEKEEKKVFRWIKKLIIIGFSAVFIYLILPSKTVIYSFAAVKTADIAYHSNKQVPEILNNTLKLINLKIQKEIKDTLKQTGK